MNRRRSQRRGLEIPLFDRFEPGFTVRTKSSQRLPVSIECDSVAKHGSCHGQSMVNDGQALFVHIGVHQCTSKSLDPSTRCSSLDVTLPEHEQRSETRRSKFPTLRDIQELVPLQCRIGDRGALPAPCLEQGRIITQPLKDRRSNTLEPVSIFIHRDDTSGGVLEQFLKTHRGPAWIGSCQLIRCVELVQAGR